MDDKGTRRYTFDPAMMGRLCECEGGSGVLDETNGALGAREFFRGRLTGFMFEEGDPAWRWHEMTDLEARPDGYAPGTVWCEEGFLFLMDDTEVSN